MFGGSVSDTWICRQLRETDRTEIARLIASSDVQARLYVREAQAHDLWWFGSVARDGGLVGAALQVEGTTATLIEAVPEATHVLGHGLLQHQKMVGKDHGDRHVVRGPAAAMARFWQGFQHNGRKVVADRTATLHAAVVAAPSRLDVRLADVTDHKLVVEFLGEATLEARGFDPRRTGREAHERRCLQVLQAGCAFVARDGGAAVLVAELGYPTADTALLEPWFVPRPLRSRKRLIAQALAPLPGLAAVAGRTLLAFADGPDLAEAMALAGWTARATYRTIEMQG